MYFEFVYQMGKSFPIFPKVQSIDDKFKLVEFPYTSADVLSGCAIIVFSLFFLGLLFLPFIQFVAYLLIFGGLIIALAAYVFATDIYYTLAMVNYREEMLQAILEISNYISLNSSVESAFVQTSNSIDGTLGKQLKNIKLKLEKKNYRTLGEAITDYVPIWLNVNPEFVKALNLLQTAALSPKEERDDIVNEVIETVILSYHESGKRFSEKLSSQTSSLIAVGVTFPLMSLILLPLVSVFLPQLANATIIAFVYDVFFPAVLLIFSMNFAVNRLQIRTIRLENSPQFKKLPEILPYILAGIAIVFTIPAIIHLTSIDMSTAQGAAVEYAFGSIFVVWLGLLGLFIAIEGYSYGYYKINEDLWNKVDEIESDLPHLLQIISSYLSLNRSFESILQDIEDDYKKHGFGSHPVVSMLDQISQGLYNTKMGIYEIIETKLVHITPSQRLNEVLKRIVLFTTIDQKSASKSAKSIRAQTISVYNLDDYIKTLLAETISVVNITIIMLAPLLAATATLMGLAIVQSLSFISDQLNKILSVLGSSPINLSFVDTTKIIPPSVIQLIVEVYFFEIALILSIFLSTIEHGVDKHQMAKTMAYYLAVSFAVYSAILLIGYAILQIVLFQGVLGVKN